MPRYLKVNIIWILFLFFAVPASPELYQYKDENGITRLTDNVYSVPVEHRSELEQFSEFEGLSDELAILPIQNQPLAQTKNPTKNQTKTDKVIHPKTLKSISAKAEKNIINPAIPPDAKKKTASKSKKETGSPFQPIISEKTVQAPAAKLSSRKTHKSKKITIDKKTTPSQKTEEALSAKNLKEKTKPDKPVNNTPEIKKESKLLAEKTPKVLPEKNVKKTVKPEAGKKPVPETKTVEKNQTEKITAKKTAPIQKNKTETKKDAQPKNIVADQKTVTAPKTAQAEPNKHIKKSAKPEAGKKPVPETKTVEKNQTEKITAKKTAPILKNKTETKKDAQPKNIVADQKTVTAPKTAQAEPRKNIKKSAKPEAGKKPVPETKTVEKNQTEKITAKKTAPIQKNKTETKNIVADQKTVTAPKTAQAEPVSVPHEIKPEIREKPALEIQKEKSEQTKTVATKQTDHKQESKASTKNVVSIKKTAPEINKAGTDQPDNTVAKKDSNFIIPALKADQKKPAETEKQEFHTRLITPDEPNSMKVSGQTKHVAETVTKSKVIEKGSNEVNEKDESLVLAKLESTRKVLSNKKEALNKKFLSLMKEKQEIETSVDEDDEKSVLKYNENVKKLNIKIKKYKKQKKILQAEIEKYNYSIKQSALN